MKKIILVFAAVLMFFTLFGCVTITDPNDTNESKDVSSDASHKADANKTYFDRAEDAFNEMDFPKMLDILYDLTVKNPDADIDTFISEKIESLEVINAPALIDAYQENELKADNTYQGKLIVVKGNIDDLGKDILDDVYISLADDEQYSFDSVRCTLKDEKEISKAAELSKGDEIYILGTVDDYLMLSVNLKNCYIVTNYMK